MFYANEVKKKKKPVTADDKAVPYPSKMIPKRTILLLNGARSMNTWSNNFVKKKKYYNDVPTQRFRKTVLFFRDTVLGISLELDKPINVRVDLRTMRLTRVNMVGSSVRRTTDKPVIILLSMARAFEN